MEQQVNANQVVYISLEISMFGGYRRSTEDDIEDAGGKAPKTTVLTKGGKHVFPPERLSAFKTNKGEIVRKILKFGVQAFKKSSVYAITMDRLAEAEKILEVGNIEHDRLATELDKNYDDWLDTYISEQDPNVQNVIRRSALTREEALSKFKYGYTAFEPTLVGKNNSAEKLKSTLVVQLYNEIAVEVLKIYDNSINPMDSSGNRSQRDFGQKTKRPVAAAREKLKAWLDFDQSIAGAIQMIDETLSQTQIAGYVLDEVGNPARTRFVKLVEMMINPPIFRTAAENVAEGREVDDVLGVKTFDQQQGNVFVPVQAQVEQAESIFVSPSETATATDPDPKPLPAVNSAEMAELAFF